MTTRVELRKARITSPNPDKFDAPIQLTVALEVFEAVPAKAIEVKFVWSPIWDFNVDQVLDELEVGPLASLGTHEFTLESDPPDFSQIPDPTGPTALLVSFSYAGEEFLHLGFNTAVYCEGEMPDVFESAEQLRRDIGKCIPRARTIAWDAAAADASAPEVGEEPHGSEGSSAPSSAGVSAGDGNGASESDSSDGERSDGEASDAESHSGLGSSSSSASEAGSSSEPPLKRERHE